MARLTLSLTLAALVATGGGSSLPGSAQTPSQPPTVEPRRRRGISLASGADAVSRLKLPYGESRQALARAKAQAAPSPPAPEELERMGADEPPDPDPFGLAGLLRRARRVEESQAAATTATEAAAAAPAARAPAAAAGAAAAAKTPADPQALGGRQGQAFGAAQGRGHRVQTFVPRPRRRREPSPLLDPLRDVKHPLRVRGGVDRGRRILEFAPDDVVRIRGMYHASQRRFATMLGINVETLRNWEQGRRSPHGPARALLRLARANPKVVAAVLLRHRYPWWLD